MECHDTVVIGSGFGGAVMACRLAERGARVLVLERGRRWTPETYPSASGRDWLWNARAPQRQNGWLDFRYFGDMSVAQGAAVGGGSLIYANVSLAPTEAAFAQGWPEAIDHAALKSHVDRAGQMLGVQTLPDNQHTDRTRLMKAAAEAIGAPERFRMVPQAVRFDPQWHYGLEDPFDVRHSKPWVNAQGRTQGTCVHCGNCDIGCPTQAKNTLDLNYLARAENLGVQIRPLHQVQCLTPEGTGYRIRVWDLAADREQDIFAGRVVLSAGSLGSTELLLRCRDQHRTLPRLSDQLGRGWTSNGDFLTPAWYSDREISPTQGPTISSAIDFLDGSDDGQRYLVEDGGFPDLLGNVLLGVARHRRVRGHRLARLLAGYAHDSDPARHLMPWFGQAVDQSGGRLSLRRRWLAPWRKDRLHLRWDYRAAEPAVTALAARHRQLTEATGGRAVMPATWKWLRNLVTPHPLGGCNMADGPATGVVDHTGEVFGYPNLFVMDGAVVPVALGLNPSRTIAALAERAAATIA